MEALFVARKDAATMLGISLRGLDRLLAEDVIESRKIGKRRLISRRILEDFVNKGRATPR